jgi:DNA-binding NtrC family response regulator
MASGSGSTWKDLRALAARAAASSSSTVLIVAPPGTPATELAREIHTLSPRAAAPFLQVDARREHELHPSAALVEARDGTLLLERVEYCADATQAALARALLAPHAARVIATLPTSPDRLRTPLREDLLYRLNGLALSIPPLRERPQEALELALAVLAKELPHARLGASARRHVLAHDWPGNEREVEWLVARAALVCDSDTLEAHHLLAPARREEPAGPALTVEARSLREVEELLIRRVLEEQGGNRSQAARVLGLHRATLHLKLRAYGIV